MVIDFILENWQWIISIIVSFFGGLKINAIISKNKKYQEANQDVSGDNNLPIQQNADFINNDFQPRQAGLENIGTKEDILDQNSIIENKSNQQYILEELKNNSSLLSVSAQFEENYEEAYQWIYDDGNNVQACAAKYYKTFKDIVETILSSDVLEDTLTPALLERFENSFSKIKEFRNNSKEDINEFKKAIKSFEDNLIFIISEL